MSTADSRAIGSRMARVGHVTSVHDWYDTRIFHHECVSLASAGYDVTLIAPRVNRESRNGVRLEPAKVSTHKIRRLLTSSLRLYPVLRRWKFDLVHLHDPELIPLGLVLSLQGQTVVLDVHEDALSLIGSKGYLGWLARPAANLVDRLQRSVSRRMAAVVTVTPEIAESIGTRNVDIVANYPDIAELESAAPASIDEFISRGPRAAYVGDLTLDRCVYEMIDAGSLVCTADAVLTLAGRPADLTPPTTASINYVGRLDRPDVAKLLGSVQVGVCVLSNRPNYRDSRPVKLFEYLAAGLPVVVARTTRWAAAFVEEYQCGIVLDDPSPVLLAAALDELFADPELAYVLGQSGREVVLEHYNWQSQERTLLAIYERCLA